MSSLRLWVKVVLFFSSYTPLFIIFLFRIFSQFSQNDIALIPIFITFDPLNITFLPITLNHIFSIIIIAIILFPNIFIVLYIKSTISANNYRTISVAHKEDMNYIYIEYLITYIIPFLSFNYINVWDVASILLLILIICYIYVNSNLLYVNIMFNFFGYNLFKIKDAKQNEYMLISRRKKLLLGCMIQIKPISDTFVVEVKGEAHE